MDWLSSDQPDIFSVKRIVIYHWLFSSKEKVLGFVLVGHVRIKIFFKLHQFNIFSILV